MASIMRGNFMGPNRINQAADAGKSIDATQAIAAHVCRRATKQELHMTFRYVNFCRLFIARRRFGHSAASVAMMLEFCRRPLYL
jgi:hypothetical protein